MIHFIKSSEAHIFTIDILCSSFTSPLIYLLLCRFAIMKHFLIICDSDNTLKLNIIYFLSGLTLWLKTKIHLLFKITKQWLLCIWFSTIFYWVQFKNVQNLIFLISVCLGKNWVYRIRLTVIGYRFVKKIIVLDFVGSLEHHWIHTIKINKYATALIFVM